MPQEETVELVETAEKVETETVVEIEFQDMVELVELEGLEPVLLQHQEIYIFKQKKQL